MTFGSVFKPSLYGAGVGQPDSTVADITHKADEAAARLDMLSVHYSVLSAIGEFASTVLRDMVVDAKAGCKDAGEAGHKP